MVVVQFGVTLRAAIKFDEAACITYIDPTRKDVTNENERSNDKVPTVPAMAGKGVVQNSRRPYRVNGKKPLR